MFFPARPRAMALILMPWAAESNGPPATSETGSSLEVRFLQTSTAGTPDPTLWGPPEANFQGSCNINDKF